MSGQSTSGSFPLLEHVALFRAELSSSSSSSRMRRGAASLAQLTPVTVITTPVSSTSSSTLSSSSSSSSSSLLNEEPALRGLVGSFATDLLRQQQRQRTGRERVARLYATLDATLYAQATDSNRNNSSSNTVKYSCGGASLPPCSPPPQQQQAAATAAAPRAELDNALFDPILAISQSSSSSSSSPLLLGVNMWPLLPTAKEGVFIQVPRHGFVDACRQWAVDSLSGSNSDSSNNGGGGGGGVPARSAATVLYADTQHYHAAHVAQAKVNKSSSPPSPRRRNDEGLLYGFALYICGDIFFPSSGLDGNNSSDKNCKEEALVLVLTSTSPVFNFMRSVGVEAALQMCAAARRAVATFEQSNINNTATSTNSSHINCNAVWSSLAAATATAAATASLLLARLMQEALEPLRPLTDPSSRGCTTAPGRPISLRLAYSNTNTNNATSYLSSSGGGGMLSLPRPADLLHPHLDTPLSLLLLSFTHDGLRLLHSLLLQEFRIVFIGATPQHASACAVAAPGLLAPLVWSSPLVPFLAPLHAAGSGLLDTLLAPSVAMSSRRVASVRQRRAMPVNSAAILESSGFIIGSTAEMVPQLMLRLSAIAAATARAESSSSGGGGGHSKNSAHGGNALELDRLWIADARTGNIGVVPLEPLSLITSTTSTSALPPTSSSSATTASGGGGGGAHFPPARVRFPVQAEEHCRAMARATSHNAAIAGSFTLVDIPPAQDKFRNAVRRAVSAEQRLSFRIAVEAVAVLAEDCASTAAEELEQLSGLLRRAANHDNSGDDEDNTNEDNVDDDDDTATNDSRNLPHAQHHCHATSYSIGGAAAFPFGGGGAGSSNSGNTSYTGSLSTSPTSGGAAAAAGAAAAVAEGGDAPLTRGSRAASATGIGATGVVIGDSLGVGVLGGVGGPPIFPTVSSAALTEVHAALLEYNSLRLFGNYRKGLSRSRSHGNINTYSNTTTTTGATSIGSSNAVVGVGGVSALDVAAFLPGNLQGGFKLAESIAATHAYRQFEQAMLCAERLGLSRVLRGDYILPGLLGDSITPKYGAPMSTTASPSSSSLVAPPQPEHCYYVSHPRMVSLLNLFIERSRGKFPDLFPDIGGAGGQRAAVMTLGHSSMDDCVAHSHRIALAAIAPSSTSSSSSSSALSSSSSSPAPRIDPRQFRLPYIAFIAGYEATALDNDYGYPRSNNGGGGGGTTTNTTIAGSDDVHHCDPRIAAMLANLNSSSTNTNTKSNDDKSSGGGGGGGVKRFFAKAAKAVKQGFTGGSGGSNSSSSGGDGSSPASTTQVSTVAVAAFLQALSSLSTDANSSNNTNSNTAAVDAKRLLKLSRRAQKHRVGKRRETFNTLVELHHSKKKGNNSSNKTKKSGGDASGGGGHSLSSPATAGIAVRRTRGLGASFAVSNRSFGLGTNTNNGNSLTGWATTNNSSTTVALALAGAAERALQEEAALVCAVHHRGALAVDFYLPPALSASDQAALASALNSNSSSSINASASSGVHHGSVEAEYLRHLGSGSGGGGGGGHHSNRNGNATVTTQTTDFPRVTGPLGPVLCRPLPLDVVHQFAQYHPLLGLDVGINAINNNYVDDDDDDGCGGAAAVATDPGSTVSYLSPFVDIAFSADFDLIRSNSNDNISGGGGGGLGGEDPTAAAALYAAMGMLVPSSVAMWRTAERLAEAALMAPQPQQQQIRTRPPPKPQPQQQHRASPPPLLPPPAQATTAGEAPHHRSVFDELFDTAPSPSRLSVGVGAVAATSTAAGGGRPTTIISSSSSNTDGYWADGFSSGVPEGFTSGAPTVTTATATVAASTTPSPSAAVYFHADPILSPPPHKQQQQREHDTTSWGNWGMQAPVAGTNNISSSSNAGHASLPAPSWPAPAPAAATDSASIVAPSPGPVMLEDLFSFQPTANTSPSPTVSTTMQSNNTAKPTAFDDFFR